MQRLYIIFHGRFPSTRAASLFAQASAHSFSAHMPTFLVVPRRLGRDVLPALPPNVRVVYLPTVDLFKVPALSRAAFLVSYFVFSLSCFIYFFFKLRPADTVLTNEALPAWSVSLLSKRVLLEVHDFPERFRFFYAAVLRRVWIVIATNNWKKQKLEEVFGLPGEKVVLERNAVDLEMFAPGNKEDARRKLNLLQDVKIALYTGHLYSWKGADTLAQASSLIPEVQVYMVGGTPHEVEQYKTRFASPNLHFIGHRPHSEVPLWQSAADVLVLPNTAKEEISAHYTSPLKLFEYMASERPIVASNIPSIAEVVGEREAFLAEPDSPSSFAAKIKQALQSGSDASLRAQQARKEVAKHSWQERARRVAGHFSHTDVHESFFGMRCVILVPVAYIGVLLTLFAPLLFGGQMFIGSDVTTQYYGGFEFYHRAIVTGQSFLWSPYLFSGFPIYLSQVGGFFDPLNYLIFSYFGGFDGTHLRLILDYFLLLTFSYAAARAWGISKLAAFCVGLGYMMAFNETFISNPLFTNSAYLMPFLVWVMGRVRNCNGYSLPLAVFAGLVVGFTFLGGYAQIIIMYLVLFGLLGILYGLIIAERKFAFVARFFGFCAVVGALGFAIGSVLILPALAFAPLTRRGGGVDYSLASLKTISPRDAILLLFPDYAYFPYLSVGRKALYIGAIWFFFALGMLRVIGRGLRQRSQRVAEPAIFALVLLFALLTAVTYSPIFYALQHLPVFNLFRFSDRWMYGGVFFLAMLGGYGFDALVQHAKERYVRRFYTLVLSIVGVVLAPIVLLNLLGGSMLESIAGRFFAIFSHTLYGHGAFTKDLGHYQDAAVRGLKAWQGFVSFGEPSFFGPFLMLVAAGIFIFLYLRHKISLVHFRLGALAIMLATFLIAVHFQLSAQLPRQQLLDSAQQFMRFIPMADRELYRYYPVFVGEAYQKVVPPTYRTTPEQQKAFIELAFASGWPNTNFLYQMPSVDGYDVFVPNTYIDTLAGMGSTFGAQDYTRSLPAEEKVALLYTNLGKLGVMSGKYIVSGLELNNPALKLLGSYTASRLSVPMYVYENSFAQPRVRIVGGRGTLGPVKFENGAATIAVTAQTPLQIIFGESNLPGWSAAVDDLPVKIAPADTLYMGVKVPAGSHLVEFNYHGQPVF